MDTAKGKKNKKGVRLIRLSHRRGRLDKLPKELLLLIAKNLARDDLARLARTCFLLNDVCEQLLYRSIVLKVVHPVKVNETSTLSAPYSTVLQSKRQLARHIRHIAITGILFRDRRGRVINGIEIGNSGQKCEDVIISLTEKLLQGLQPNGLLCFEYHGVPSLYPTKVMNLARKHENLSVLDVPAPTISHRQFEYDDYRHLLFPGLKKLRLSAIQEISQFIAAGFILTTAAPSLRYLCVEFDYAGGIKLFNPIPSKFGIGMDTAEVLEIFGLKEVKNMRLLMDTMVYEPITTMKNLETLIMYSGTMRPQLVDYAQNTAILTSLVLTGGECPRLHCLLQGEKFVSLRLNRLCIALFCEDSCGPLALDFALGLDQGLESFQFLDAAHRPLHPGEVTPVYVSDEDSEIDKYPEDDLRALGWWEERANDFMLKHITTLKEITGLGRDSYFWGFNDTKIWEEVALSSPCQPEFMTIVWQIWILDFDRFMAAVASEFREDAGQEEEEDEDEDEDEEAEDEEAEDEDENGDEGNEDEGNEDKTEEEDGDGDEEQEQADEEEEDEEDDSGEAKDEEGAEAEGDNPDPPHLNIFEFQRFPGDNIVRYQLGIAGCTPSRRRLLPRLKVIHVVPATYFLPDTRDNMAQALAEYVGSQLCTSTEQPRTEWILVSLLEHNLDYYFKVKCTRKPKVSGKSRYDVALTLAGLENYLVAGMPRGFLDATFARPEQIPPYARNAVFYQR